MVDIVIRRMTEAEKPFIFNSWLQSYRKSSFAYAIPSHLYYLFHHAIIERIMKRPTCAVWVASHVSTPDVVLGYIVYDGLECPAIHFAYTKLPFRGLGLAHALVGHLNALYGVLEGPSTHTHRVKDMDKLLKALGLTKSSYNPYLI